MGVSNITIINKMIQELDKAQINAEEHTKMVQHIEHVKLLCDLLLDDKPTDEPVQKPGVSAEEMKAMVGNTGSVQKPSISSSDTVKNLDDANGKSIFDF